MTSSLAIDPLTLIAILAMALTTYGTRIAGLFLTLHHAPSAPMQAALDAIPPAVLIAVVAPMMLATGWPETIATALTALAATRLPLVATVAFGAACVVALRLALGG
ncbi:MAG TPA: AzlD domain-containing protein [Roseiarcus sp.]|nr:AzlD domain-containing protein [Roseiarcus sp.]